MPEAAISRPFDFRLALSLPLTLMTALLLFDPERLDFAVTRLFYVPGEGFSGRHSYWLENILHDRVKQFLIALGVLALAAFCFSLWVQRLKPWRRVLGYLVLSIGLSTSFVTPLKKLTNIQCPWDLTEFGGTERFNPLIGAHPQTENPGRCWPGGQASAGFSLIALYFALRDRRPRAARFALGVALILGGLMSAGRVMQGAHFLSHNLWTLLFDWVLCVLCYRLILYRSPEPATAHHPSVAVPSLRALGDVPSAL